jgi:hypothetical protein
LSYGRDTAPEGNADFDQFPHARGESKKSYFPVQKEKVSFVAIVTALLESSVWRSLGIYDRRFIDQILIVHARTGGVKNGYLRLTHLQLRAAGIDGDRIKPTIDNLVRLRLLEVTHQGGARQSVAVSHHLYAASDRGGKRSRHSLPTGPRLDRD